MACLELIGFAHIDNDEAAACKTLLDVVKIKIFNLCHEIARFPWSLADCFFKLMMRTNKFMP